MKQTGAKMGLCGVLAALALISAASAVAGGPRGEAVPVSAAVETEEIYVLREYDGYIGIYIKGKTRLPVTVTDIEVRSLTGADRELVQAGLDVQGRENLMMILEDLGS